MTNTGRGQNIFPGGPSFGGGLPAYFKFNKSESLILVFSLFFGAAAFLPMTMQGDSLAAELNFNRVREAGFLLLALALILFVCYKHGALRMVHKSVFPFILSLFVFWAILSSPWSNTPGLSLAKAAELGLTLVIATLIASVVARRLILLDKFPALLFLAIALIIAVYLILNVFIWGTPFPLVNYPEEGEVTYEGRLRFLFAYTHPLVSADVLAIGIICLLNSDLKKRYQFPLLIFISVLLWLTDARGPLSAAVFAALAIIFFSIRHYGAKLVLTLTSVGLVPLILVVDFLVIGVSVWGSDATSLNGRIGLWSSIFDVFFKKPVTGFGYFSTRSLMLTEFPWAGHAHNTFLEVLLTTGIVGGILFVIFTGSLLYLLFKTNDKLLLGLSVYCYIAGFLNPLLFIPSFPMFILMLGVLRAYVCWKYKTALRGRKRRADRKFLALKSSGGQEYFLSHTK